MDEDTGTTPVGSCLELKQVDEIYDKQNREWVARDAAVPERKKDSSNKDGKGKYAKYAFTVVRKFDQRYDPADFMFETLLDIKSLQLKKVCEEVIGASKGVSWTLTPLRLKPRLVLTFLPDFERYASTLCDRLSKSKSEDDALALAHLDFFLAYLRTEHHSTLSTLSSLLAHAEITFDLLWAIFVPRSIIYTKCTTTGEPRAMRITHAEQRATCNGAPYWGVDVEYVEYNDRFHRDAGGTSSSAPAPQYGLAAPPCSLAIHHFEGAVKVASLPHYPIAFHPRAREVKAALVERGRRWAALQGVRHMHYKGTATSTGVYAEKYVIDSRVMVDRKTFTTINPNYSLPSPSKALDGSDIEAGWADEDEDEDDCGWGSTQNRKRQLTPAEKTAAPPVDLSEEHLLLTSPVVYGFALADKLWLLFNVEHVSSFEWSDEPFANLVLPPAQKKLVQALVETHSGNTNNDNGNGNSNNGNDNGGGFDDFVKGKGRGLVINLFGNPGVGKSLTAEATSEHVRKPLYVVGAGDLGITASALDENLTKIFNISASWGAVVLIDEADVFLEERSVHDLQRNAIVAVFLRQLEYFRGILFLTTNRVKTFDEAFQSRIHVSLRYRDLKPDARRQIWVAFLKKVKTTASAGTQKQQPATDVMTADADLGVTTAELLDLSERPVNGRQIKNVVKTASALALACGEGLAYTHLVQVLEMMAQFEVDREEMTR